MGGASPTGGLRVALLFTRYPVATETFLRREVQALRDSGGTWDVLALWSVGSDRSGPPATRTFSPWALLRLLWWIPYWLIRRPAAMQRLASRIIEGRCPNPLNFWENMLGLGYALVRAREMVASYDHLHAVWASAPASAAWALRQLTGIPYSMAGHAYDLYEDGGDGWLEPKIRAACMIRTSTEAGRRRWLAFGARPEQIHVIRRGLHPMPEFVERSLPLRPPYQLLAVGRMVEKMGYPFILETLSELEGLGLPFRAVLAGGGPLLASLRAEAEERGLAGRVTFTGSLPFEEVEALFREADCFLFAGRVARSGDRAGFPNAIGEAMAIGVPVCATDVGAVTEGIRDNETGLIVSSPTGAARRISGLVRSPETYEQVRRAAREWVVAEFNAAANMKRFAQALFKAHPQSPS